MWGRKKRKAEPKPEDPQRLRDALRQARIESAERTGVIVDLRDAEVARLELLNEALDPLFAEVPDTIEMFDRGIAHGDTPHRRARARARRRRGPVAAGLAAPCARPPPRALAHLPRLPGRTCARDRGRGGNARAAGFTFARLISLRFAQARRCGRRRREIRASPPRSYRHVRSRRSDTDCRRRNRSPCGP